MVTADLRQEAMYSTPRVPIAPRSPGAFSIARRNPIGLLMSGLRKVSVALQVGATEVGSGRGRKRAKNANDKNLIRELKCGKNSAQEGW